MNPCPGPVNPILLQVIAEPCLLPSRRRQDGDEPSALICHMAHGIIVEPVITNAELLHGTYGDLGEHGCPIRIVQGIKRSPHAIVVDHGEGFCGEVEKRVVDAGGPIRYSIHGNHLDDKAPEEDIRALKEKDRATDEQ